MAAPDLETLLDFETNVEAAAKTFLSTATGLAASSAFASLDQDDLVLPRFSAMFELGEALDPTDAKTTGSSQLEYRKYTGTLSVMVSTNAAIDGTETNHRSIRTKVRSALLLNALNFSGGTPDAMVVDGAGDDAVEGMYLRDGENAEKPLYTLSDGTRISDSILYDNSTSTIWAITSSTQGERGSALYISVEDVATPDLATTWNVEAAGTAPAPTVRRATWADIEAAGIDSLTVPILAGTEYLPYYDVNYLRPTGTTMEIDGDIATSTLAYEMNLVIRKDAWPA